MQVCQSVASIRKVVASYRLQGESVALVPTMGFLHEGHMELVRKAHEVGDRVVVWIFVNPTQFEKSDDLAAYPRDLDRDLAMLKAEGVDVVFTPEAYEIYPEGSETIVETTHMANMLHGLVRPGHFRGVTTVVAKFFNIIQPDFAMFGEKDYQQLQIVKRMVRDLIMPIEIVGVQTVRERDGLAMSSRNVRLGNEDRKAALILSQSLDHAEAMAPTRPTVTELQNQIASLVSKEPRAKLEGCDIVAAESLAKIDGPIDGPTAIMISVQVGPVLLIDQRVISP
ncbi:MAG: pantoate--beta-alanine ligase [Paracoccaceae bacterium]|nr:pantoate--beta-alanine ligase [Paracoccaceae bacterium]MDG1739207.1 pantoate--beta-alanine ligase [Paracoccaceae bacterium]MDG2258046.1 pantoate--beta-alanine ligase [Paracoccaceae bacterium]